MAQSSANLSIRGWVQFPRAYKAKNWVTICISHSSTLLSHISSYTIESLLACFTCIFSLFLSRVSSTASRVDRIVPLSTSTDGLWLCICRCLEKGFKDNLFIQLFGGMLRLNLLYLIDSIYIILYSIFRMNRSEFCGVSSS